MGQAAVAIKGLTKRFRGTEVLRNVDLAVQPGEVLVLLGPSGAGKSTLIRCINGLEQADSGEILIDGELLPSRGRALQRARSRMGMVFQAFNLFPHMSALRNVTLAPMHVRGESRAAAAERAHQLLNRVGLAHKADAYPAEEAAPPGQVGGGPAGERDVRLDPGDNNVRERLARHGLQGGHKHLQGQVT